jgi:hypothetical protein
MTGSEITAERPMRHISRWKVFGVFCLVVFLFFFGVVFIPWDVKAPNDADLQYTPLTLEPGKNAFTYLEAAGKMQVIEFSATATRPCQDWIKLPSRIGSPSEEWNPAFADEVLAANVAVFPEVEKGLACEHYAHPVGYDWSARLPWLRQHRDLVSLLLLKSKRVQLTGDSIAAAHAVSQAWLLSEKVANNASYLIVWQVGINCQHDALERFDEIISDVKTPESVLRNCLVQLTCWDPQRLSGGYKQAMQVEYQMVITAINHPCVRHDYLRNAEREPRYLVMVPYCFKPKMTAGLFAPYYRHLIGNADRTYVGMSLNYPGRPKDPLKVLDKAEMFINPNSIGKIMFFLRVLAFDVSTLKKYQLEASVAALRMKIALRLYEQKHGRLPDDLKALIPDLLKEIPRDPYDGQPFRYSKTERKVWAVGRDLKDDGGKMKDDRIMVDLLGSDLVLPLGTREMKPTPPPPLGNKPKE